MWCEKCEKMVGWEGCPHWEYASEINPDLWEDPGMIAWLDDLQRREACVMIPRLRGAGYHLWLAKDKP